MAPASCDAFCRRERGRRGHAGLRAREQGCRTPRCSLDADTTCACEDAAPCIPLAATDQECPPHATTHTARSTSPPWQPSDRPLPCTLAHRLGVRRLHAPEKEVHRALLLRRFTHQNGSHFLVAFHAFQRLGRGGSSVWLVGRLGGVQRAGRRASWQRGELPAATRRQRRCRPATAAAPCSEHPPLPAPTWEKEGPR